MSRHMFSITGVSNVTGLKQKELRRLLSTGGFPRPDAWIGSIPGWGASTIWEWNENNGRGNQNTNALLQCFGQMEPSEIAKVMVTVPLDIDAALADAKCSLS